MASDESAQSVRINPRMLLVVVIVICLAIIAYGKVRAHMLAALTQPIARGPLQPLTPPVTADKVAIAADPYDTPDKAKIFSINFHEHGLLPIFFIVTNDGDQPLSIANMQVTLTTANRSKLTPIASEDIFRRLSNPHQTQPIPIPIPQKKVKGLISQKERDEVESSQFVAKAVEPHTTQSGFFFFDVDDVTAPVEGAHLFITGVNDAKGTELMYFEIVLAK